MGNLYLFKISVLASLNLPGALDALEQNIGLPSSILEKSNQVKTAGGARELEQLWETLQALATTDSTLLDEALQVLDEEEAQDDRMKSQFRDKWNRTPSNQLNQNLRSAATSFQAKLAAAAKSDLQIKQAMDSNMHLIQAICGTKVIISYL